MRDRRTTWPGSPPPPEGIPRFWESFLAVSFTVAVLLGIVGAAFLMPRWFPPVPHYPAAGRRRFVLRRSDYECARQARCQSLAAGVRLRPGPIRPHAGCGRRGLLDSHRPRPLTKTPPGRRSAAGAGAGTATASPKCWTQWTEWTQSPGRGRPLRPERQFCPSCPFCPRFSGRREQPEVCGHRSSR